MPSELLNYSLPVIGKPEREMVSKVLQTKSVSQGAYLRDFENQLAHYCGVKHAVAVSSGSAALHLAYLAAGIKPGDQVVIPAVTFASTAASALHCGADPVLGDISPENLALDTRKVKSLLNSEAINPKLIVPVSMGGYGYDRQEIHRIAGEYQIPVIADLSHAMGTEYREESGGWLPFTDGRFELAGVVSFQALKNITTGEGGAVLTNDEEFAEEVRKFRNHGIQSGNLQDEPWRYDIINPGFNYRISEMQCAMGVAQLRQLPEFQKNRKKLVDNYFQAFRGVDEIGLPPQQDKYRNSWHLFIIRIPERKKLYDRLMKAGYKCQVHYVPLHYLTFMKPYARKVPTDLSASEKYYQQCLSLPLFPDLEQRHQDEIIRMVKDHLGAV